MFAVFVVFAIYAMFIRKHVVRILMAEEKEAVTLVRSYKGDVPRLKIVQALMSIDEKKTLNQEDVLRALIDDFLKERDSRSKATTPDTLEVPV